MADRDELVKYTNDLLATNAFRDYCPNGLQVEGKKEIRKLISGVTASMALIDAAIEADADALLVHHGWFWKGESTRLTGIRARRARRMLESNLNLLAYHLPLDAHAELGNNAQLGLVLGWEVTAMSGPVGEPALVFHTEFEQAWSASQVAAHLESRLDRPPLHVSGGVETIKRIGWCTGAAQSWIGHAVELELDAFISGEISEQTVHTARECGIDYFAAGHHATERYGVQALGAELARKFDLEHKFIDIDNPV